MRDAPWVHAWAGNMSQTQQAAGWGQLRSTSALHTHRVPQGIGVGVPHPRVLSLLALGSPSQLHASQASLLELTTNWLCISCSAGDGCCAAAVQLPSLALCASLLAHRIVLVCQLCCTLCQRADPFNFIEQFCSNLALEHIIQE